MAFHPYILSIYHLAENFRVTYFVQSNNEGCLSILEQVEGFDSLRFKTVLQDQPNIHFNIILTHRNVHNENSNVTQATTPSSQVCETFVSRRIDNEQTRDLNFVLSAGIDDSRLFLNSSTWEECRSDLLGNTTGFTFLYGSLTNLRDQLSPARRCRISTDLIQQLGFTRIDMSENTTNRTSEILLVLSRLCLHLPLLNLLQSDRFPLLSFVL